MAFLSNKIGDNLLKVRQSSEEAFMAAAYHPLFGVKLCLSFIVNEVPLPPQPGAKKPKKLALTSKQISAKYQVLHKMLLGLEFGKDQLSQAAGYSVKGLTHTSNDVRDPAYDCMGELYRQMGEKKLSQFYDGLR
mmetsp:Transcript_11417/g.19276  ORF Transcript_11417/g.19276 Transcript_11417/m.19276 type:complete len:134 (+) Transcript_11417:1737-2138(+)